MELRVVSPQQIYSYAIVWIELQTTLGSFVIQYGHAPMLLPLAFEKPVTFRLKNGKQESITIQKAVAEITRTNVTILTNAII